MEDGLHQFIVIKEAYERYDIVMDIISGESSVYCLECDEWVASFDEEQFSTGSSIDLYEKIMEQHFAARILVE